MQIGDLVKDLLRLTLSPHKTGTAQEPQMMADMQSILERVKGQGAVSGIEGQ